LKKQSLVGKKDVNGVIKTFNATMSGSTRFRQRRYKEKDDNRFYFT
jgi:hypothetical protein